MRLSRPRVSVSVVGAEEVHVLVVLGQLEGDVRDDHPQGEGLNADLLIGVLALGVQEPHNVRVVGVEVHRAGTLAGAGDCAESHEKTRGEDSGAAPHDVRDQVTTDRKSVV